MASLSDKCCENQWSAYKDQSIPMKLYGEPHDVLTTKDHWKQPERHAKHLEKRTIKEKGHSR